MVHTRHELESLILANPLNDSLRVELEELLSTIEPNEVELELLRRERQIADVLELGHSADDLIHEYQQFRIAQFDYFWDVRGCVNHIFRPFSLWLSHCDSSREFALNVAVQHKLDNELDFDSLPIEIVRGKQPDSALELKNGIIEFVRRYRGPSGTEPDLGDTEIGIIMLATYSAQKPIWEN